MIGCCRYELEKALLEGKIAVDDLPKLWNQARVWWACRLAAWQWWVRAWTYPPGSTPAFGNGHRPPLVCLLACSLRLHNVKGALGRGHIRQATTNLHLPWYCFPPTQTAMVLR